MEFKWYTADTSKVLEKIGSTENGLNEEEVQTRLKTYGRNILPEAQSPTIFSVFLLQFVSPLILILIAAAVAVMAIGEITDGIIILFVLVFNAVVGTVQEGKAQNTLKALKHFIEGTATVLRAGKTLIIPDHELVPGDIILLQEGEKVPADARVLLSRSLKANESSLTGESVPVGKISDALSTRITTVADQKNMVWKGTNIVSGNGHAVVVATGLATEIGKISAEISSIDTDMPLKKNMASLSRILMGIVLVVGVLIFVFGIISGESVREMFAIVVSITVSIIPEGLPIVITLVLARGVWRMTKQDVLVKKLEAVEALGQATVIAVDKTGTLTKNEMVLKKVYIGGRIFSINGEGYESKSASIALDATLIEPLDHPDLLLAGRIARFSANGRALFIEETKEWKVSGDPTEAAMAVFSEKVGFKDSSHEAQKIFELPFDYLTRFHLNIYSFNKKNFMSVVGAPEKVVDLCDKIWKNHRALKFSTKDKEQAKEMFLSLSREGYRVIAFSFNKNSEATADTEKLPSLIFGGFFAMKDPLRAEIKNSVMKAHDAGIKVVMITGDHKITAQAIAREAGISTGHDGVITGEELEKLSDLELLPRLADTTVFARVTPNHKLRIIELFRKRGDIIAMTGDGVNDAPSLSAADLGVAMGVTGTEVAKEASDLVLLDDNFGNIISAVEEGRNIYKSIKKVILYLFSTNLGEVLIVLGAMVIGLPLPILPTQIIWLNFVTDGFLDVSLAMEPTEDGLLKKKFARPKKYLIDKLMLVRIFLMALPMTVVTLLVFHGQIGTDMTKAWTMSLTIMAAFQWFNVWNCRSEEKSLFSLDPFSNKYLAGATALVISLQLFAIYNPFMQRILHTTALNISDWLIVISAAASIVLVEEIRKYFYRLRFFKKVGILT